MAFFWRYFTSFIEWSLDLVKLINLHLSETITVITQISTLVMLLTFAIGMIIKAIGVKHESRVHTVIAGILFIMMLWPWVSLWDARIINPVTGLVVVSFVLLLSLGLLGGFLKLAPGCFFSSGGLWATILRILFFLMTLSALETLSFGVENWLSNILIDLGGTN